MSIQKGKLFNIDGPDGSGKETQSRRLVDHLRSVGRQVQTISFPRYNTPSGRVVRSFLRGEFGDSIKLPAEFASALFIADRLAAKELLDEWLSSGQDVVADRYVPSNMAYQGAKMKTAARRAEFFDWEERVEYDVFGLPRPDLVLIMGLDAKTGQSRANRRDQAQLGAGFKDQYQENLVFLRAVVRTYGELAKRPGFVLVPCDERRHDGRHIEIVQRSVEQIHGLIWEAVAPLLG